MTVSTYGIEKFVADFGKSVYVRGAVLARELGCRELRTRKNDHLACVWDELDNVFVLTKAGTRMQLVGAEANWL